MITAAGGCGYVSASWSVINNVPDDVMCGIGRFNVTLSSVDLSMTVITTMISYNFTGLPYDTIFNVTVIGTSINEKNIIDVAFISVRTMESMYVLCKGSYVHINYMYIACHIVYVELLVSQIFNNSC